MALNSVAAPPRAPARSIPLAWFAVGLVVAAGVGVAGASAYVALRPGPAAAPSPGTIALTDDLGRNVTVPYDPARIVVLSPSIMDSVYRLGLRGHVVGVDCYLPAFGGLSADYSSDQIALWNLAPSMCVQVAPTFDIEALLNLTPQVVFASTIVSVASVEEISTTYHIPVVMLQPATLSGVLIDDSLLGRIFAVGTVATAINAKLTEELANASALPSKVTAYPTVLVTYSTRFRRLLLLWPRDVRRIAHRARRGDQHLRQRHAPLPRALRRAGPRGEPGPYRLRHRLRAHPLELHPGPVLGSARGGEGRQPDRPRLELDHRAQSDDDPRGSPRAHRDLPSERDLARVAVGGDALAGPGRRATDRGGPRSAFWLAVLAAATVGLMVVSPLIGPVRIPAPTVVEILLHHLSGGGLFPAPCAGTGASPSLCNAYDEIVWASRLPEVLLAVLAGAALGMAGGTLQGVFRNPLADPFLLGISSGGTLGAATVLIFHVGAAEASLFLPLFAFLGASATGGVLLLVARGRYGSVETLLLTGVALANFLSAVLALFLLYNPIASQQVDFWLLGGLGEASWTGDGIALGVLIIAGTLLTMLGRELNLMQLGNDVAQTAGVDARAVRFRLILLASLVTAVAVAFTGIIGFVGLVSPHIVRRLAGSDYRIVLPGAGAVGAIFLLGARDLSLLAFPTSVLPLGIFTAFGGVPFFLYLLYRQRSATTMGG